MRSFKKQWNKQNKQKGINKTKKTGNQKKLQQKQNKKDKKTNQTKTNKQKLTNKQTNRNLKKKKIVTEINHSSTMYRMLEIFQSRRIQS